MFDAATPVGGASPLSVTPGLRLPVSATSVRSPVVRARVAADVVIRPIVAVALIVIVRFEPYCVQVFPSPEVNAANTLPVRVNLSQVAANGTDVEPTFTVTLPFTVDRDMSSGPRSYVIAIVTNREPVVR